MIIEIIIIIILLLIIILCIINLSVAAQFVPVEGKEVCIV